MGNFYNYGFGHMFGFGWIFMVVFWGLIIWGIFALIKGSAHGGDSKKKEENKALEILKERYAKSDISKEEFEEKKKNLM